MERQISRSKNLKRGGKKKKKGNFPLRPLVGPFWKGRRKGYLRNLLHPSSRLVTPSRANPSPARAIIMLLAEPARNLTAL